jgi:hypothetical protein
MAARPALAIMARAMTRYRFADLILLERCQTRRDSLGEDSFDIYAVPGDDGVLIIHRQGVVAGWEQDEMILVARRGANRRVLARLFACQDGPGKCACINLLKTSPVQVDGRP